MKFTSIRVHSWFHRCSWLHSWPALIALAAAIFRLASPDVPLGLAWGRAIYERRALPSTNVFSHMNPDHIVLLDKWLFQLCIYVVHLLSGPAGLIVLRVALLAVALFAAAKFARLQWNRTPHALLGVCFAMALLNRCYVRAELVTWATIPLTMMLMPFIAKGRKRGWLLLIILQAVWANSHGYWIVGPMLWAAAGIGALLQPILKRLQLSEDSGGDSRAKTRLLIAAVVALAASCLTPYGIKTIAHPIRLAIELHTDDILSRAVDDFGSPLEAIRRGGTIPFWACCAMGIIGIIAVILLARRRKLEGDRLGIFALALVISLPLYRNFTILALCALPLAADWLRRQPRMDTNESTPTGGTASTPSDARSGWNRTLQRNKRWRYSLAALPALLWLGITFTAWGPATDYGARIPGLGWHYGKYPISAANWIARNVPSAELWNDFETGGWLNWRLGEGKSYIDGNTDGYPLDFLREHRERFYGSDIEPWTLDRNSNAASLVNFGEKDAHLSRFLFGISRLETPGIGFVDRRYCVVLPSDTHPAANDAVKDSLWRYAATRVKSGELSEGFSLKLLTATSPSTPNDLYVRSGRLAIWLYPDEQEAKAHYEKTSGTGVREKKEGFRQEVRTE